MKLLDIVHRQAIPDPWTEGEKIPLEPHTFSAVRKMGEQPSSWHSADGGLFSDQAHILLTESFWDADRRTATERYDVVDALTGDVTRQAASAQAYADREYESFLLECGFGETESHPSLSGGLDASQTDLIVIVSGKQRAT